ncbi:hypothetical protein SAMN07250955_11926 [Arboricoccus pini]|uniref:Uncharacterized protein n=1 Tax=Arboricoccus pini TaxID=1963835 RepID=A0A212S0U1_9PROT|nr:hypothetical protein SAMN07250955_11926 [Arboricoccus pini]
MPGIEQATKVPSTLPLDADIRQPARQTPTW